MTQHALINVATYYSRCTNEIL